MKLYELKKGLIKLEHINYIYSKIVNDTDYLMFILSPKKKILELGVYFNRNTEEIVFSLVKLVTEFLLKKRVYLNRIFVGKNRRYWCVVSKKKISKNKMSIKEYGILLGIPKCCVDKYCEEDKGNGYSDKSCERYFNQLKKMGLKDKFKIFFKPNETGDLGYGFVPCSPKCPNALAYLKKLKKTEKFDLTK